MSSNPLNLVLRFLLELTALAALFYWGWTHYSGVMQPVTACGAPILAATIWGVFRVPDDPGKPPIKVRGFIRLALEIAFFASAVLALIAANQPTAAAVFGTVIVFHYVISYDRILWLLREN